MIYQLKVRLLGVRPPVWRRVQLAGGATLADVHEPSLAHWRHEVLVEKVEPPEVGAAYPRCTGGRRACPPEDSGGAWGHAGDILIHRVYAVTYANHGAAR